MIFEKLREVMADIFAVDPSEIRLETDFSGDLFADYEDMLELSMIIEEEFGITVDDEDFPRFHTVGDLTAYISERTGDSPG